MEGIVGGDIVVIPFPFSDLSKSKKRPALVIKNLIGDDVILCQITSKEIKDVYSIPLSLDHFAEGTLLKPSNIRPNRIFTADKNIIIKRVGHINKVAFSIVIEKICTLLKS